MCVSVEPRLSPGLFSLLSSLLWVFLHVPPDRVMTMDYFLLLCSLLLPLVSAVEGKIFHPSISDDVVIAGRPEPAGSKVFHGPRFLEPVNAPGPGSHYTQYTFCNLSHLH